ncbi:MAG: M81 family metallopeptidase [Alphaproteobacteria bacterium]|nr:M81 family metallopeptidase [Alphaproteobacteria bacterium]
MSKAPCAIRKGSHAVTEASNPRIAILGVILESNRSSPVATRADFESHYVLEGAALLSAAREPNSVIAPEAAAFVQIMDATGPWQPVPILLAACHPHGPVDGDTMGEFIATVTAGLEAAGPLDGVYIANHGAMVATDSHDPDGALFEAVRSRVGPDVPVVVTLDLHANISDRMAAASDMIIGYRTNPHVDMIERGEEAAAAMRKILAGRVHPKMYVERLPLTPASVNLLTASGPYGAMIDMGQRRQAEEAGRILNVSVFGGFVFSDTPDNGLAVVVTARNELDDARILAKELAAIGWQTRSQFRKKLTSIEDAVRMTLDTARPPVIFADSGDNPGGGGSGCTSAFLRTLIEAGPDNLYYGSFFDPELAKAAHAAGVGNTFEATFNAGPGKTSYDHPLSTRAEVLALHDGDVVGRLGLFAGRRLHLGSSAAIRIGGITVIVISDRSQTADPMFFEMFGLDIANAKTVVVKSRGHFRAGFLPWFPSDRVYEIDTEGLTSPVLERRQWHHLPRPVYPLDEDVVWSP